MYLPKHHTTMFEYAFITVRDLGIDLVCRQLDIRESYEIKINLSGFLDVMHWILGCHALLECLLLLATFL